MPTHSNVGPRSSIGPAIPLACDMSAFSDAERQHYHALRAKVMEAVEDVTETPRGFRARLGPTVTAREIAEWMALEQRCCPFLDLGLRLTSDRARWLELEGGDGVKALLRGEFKALRDPNGDRLRRPGMSMHQATGIQARITSDRPAGSSGALPVMPVRFPRPFHA